MTEIEETDKLAAEAKEIGEKIAEHRFAIHLLMERFHEMCRGSRTESNEAKTLLGIKGFEYDDTEETA